MTADGPDDRAGRTPDDPPPRITQTASGENVIQQVGNGVARIFDIDVNVSWLGGGVIGLAVLVLATVVGIAAYSLTRPDPVERLEGPGLKVAVAPFAGDDDGGHRVADAIATDLTTSLDAASFTIAGPSRVKRTPSGYEDAALHSSDLGADLMVYGTLEPARGREGAMSVEQRMLVASQSTVSSSPLVFDERIGPPYVVVPSDLASIEGPVDPSLAVVVSFVGGVGALAVDEFESARQQFAAARVAAEGPGLEDTAALAETMAGYTDLRQATAEASEADGISAELLDSADAHFAAALGLDPDYDFARAGQLNTRYLRAFSPFEPVSDDQRVELEALVAEFDALAAATSDPFTRATAEAQAAQATIVLAPRDGTGLDDARIRFESLLDSLPDLEQRPWGLFESFISEKLGLIAATQSRLDDAIDRYDTATDHASPYWAAFYLAAIGELVEARDGPCESVDWFEDAAATARRFPERAAEYDTRAELAATDCSQ